MLTEIDIEDFASENTHNSEQWRGCVNGATWANEQNAAEIAELQKELAHTMEEVDSLRIGRDRLQGEKAELLALLEVINIECEIGSLVTRFSINEILQKHGK